MAGLIFIAGNRGIALAIAFLSVLNGWEAIINGGTHFWMRELYLILGGGIGVMVLGFLNSKANHHHVVMGLTGGMISLVLFGAFLSPLAAVITWALVVGTGLIPKQKRNSKIWGIAPTAWRCILGLAFLIYGNILI